MDFTATFLVTAVVVLTFMLCAYFASSGREDNGVADVAWGIGFIVAAFTSMAVNDAVTMRKILISTLVFVWGVRLASYIWLRRHYEGEDPRFRDLRAQWGKYASLRSFLQIFVLQGLLLVLVAFPVIYVNTYGGPTLTVLDGLGTVLWIIGFLFESVADYQLWVFKKKMNNRGKLLVSGLWKYTRHPNYFGESLMWWGIFTIALSVPGGYTTAIGPMLLTLLLLRVSGVPILERRHFGDPKYKMYQETTSTFIPWFPKEQHPENNASISQ